MALSLAHCPRILLSWFRVRTSACHRITIPGCHAASRPVAMPCDASNVALSPSLRRSPFYLFSLPFPDFHFFAPSPTPSRPTAVRMEIIAEKSHFTDALKLLFRVISAVFAEGLNMAQGTERVVHETFLQRFSSTRSPCFVMFFCASCEGLLGQ